VCTGSTAGVAAEALRRYGVPEEVLTDNGKQFTDRFGKARKYCSTGFVGTTASLIGSPNPPHRPLGKSSGFTERFAANSSTTREWLVLVVWSNTRMTTKTTVLLAFWYQLANSTQTARR
jgi:hypothetical protein